MKNTTRIEYEPSKKCLNKEVYYTCYRCGKCGRKFDEKGFLIKLGKDEKKK